MKSSKSSLNHYKKTLNIQMLSIISMMFQKDENEYISIRRKYSEILYQWGLMEKRNEIMSSTNTELCISSNYSKGCYICRLPIRGLCLICLKCSHGGHLDHMREWFKKYNYCPSGCKCLCEF